MRMNSRLVAGLLPPLAVLAFAAPVAAQSADTAAPQPADANQDVIVVTAQFREQNLQNTPIAITAMSSEMLSARGQTDIGQVTAQAPGVNLQPEQGSFGPSLAAPQQPQEPPCYKDFMALRQEADKKGRLIQEASKKKVPPTVACKLFNDYSASEAKLVKYASTNATKCEIPKEIVNNLTKSHSKTNEIRNRVCEVAASGPPKPRGPSLSDALSAPVPDSGNIKTGRGGTFDTLSGGALGK